MLWSTAILAIQSVRSLVVCTPALTSKQHLDTAIAIADPDLGDLAEACAEHCLWRPDCDALHERTAPSAP